MYRIENNNNNKPNRKIAFNKQSTGYFFVHLKKINETDKIPKHLIYI